MMTRVLSVSVAVLLVSGCEKERGGAAAGTESLPVVARVNGRPITAFELSTRLRPLGVPRPGEKTGPEQEKAALEQMIRQELEAQKALELKLDQTPAFQEELLKMEAQARDWKRKELSKLYRGQELLSKAAVSDDEVKRFFDEHTAEVQTELAVAQLPFRNREQAEAAQAALAQGKSFDELAAPLYPGVPPEQRPWENPALRYENVPKPWRAELARLEPGAVSGIISAPGEQYWILKLVGRRQNPDITFEVARPGLKTLLQAQRFEERTQQLEKALREKATVELVAPAPAAP